MCLHLLGADYRGDLTSFVFLSSVSTTLWNSLSALAISWSGPSWPSSFPGSSSRLCWERLLSFSRISLCLASRIFSRFVSRSNIWTRTSCGHPSRLPWQLRRLEAGAVLTADTRLFSFFCRVDSPGLMSSSVAAPC